MTTHNTPYEGIYLDPGEVVGNRFRVERLIYDDPQWPYRASDLHDNGQTVQLAVRAIGPWMSGDTAEETWSDIWTQPIQADVIPMISCPRLRHSGGVIAAAALKHYPPPEVPPDASPGHPSDRASSPVSIEWRVESLRRLHLATKPIEALHSSGRAHGSLTMASFRIDEQTGAYLIRPTAGLTAMTTSVSNMQDRDIRSLKHLVLAITHTGSVTEGRRGYRSVFADMGTSVRARLRAVLRRQEAGIVKWRRALDQLIREVEAALLTEESLNNRYGIVTALLQGDFDTALHLAKGSGDGWCLQLSACLSDKRVDTHKAYMKWLEEHRGQPLIESAEQLTDLLAGGFSLPQATPVDHLHRRLSSGAMHLREAAANIQNASWPDAHRALSAAVTQDPGNPGLAAIVAIIASITNNRREHGYDPC